MLRCLLWLSILLALPGGARADGAGVAASIPPAVADAAPVLDLSLDPAPPPPGRQLEPARGDTAGGEAAPEKPITFGLVISTRHEVGDEARQASDEQTLTDEVSGLVKRSTFGLSGTYHF